ncbi:MAG: regulatory iron-sulfur-containing complex subunit RicT [Chloroflexota bacterium]
MINTEADPEFNIKYFHNELSRKIKNVRIELQQIGPRDVAKAFGGMGACGLETRCCSKYMTEFTSISIRMAKTQNISLTPSEITGMCGRLRCCLLFEYEYYAEARKNLPKQKKMVLTPAGEGKVIQVLPLSQSVIVNIPEIGPRKFSKDELERAEMDAQGLVDEEKINEKAELESIQTSEIEQTQKNNKVQNNKRPEGNQRSRRRRK